MVKYNSVIIYSPSRLFLLPWDKKKIWKNFQICEELTDVQVIIHFHSNKLLNFRLQNRTDLKWLINGVLLQWEWIWEKLWTGKLRIACYNSHNDSTSLIPPKKQYCSCVCCIWTQHSSSNGMLLGIFGEWDLRAALKGMIWCFMVSFWRMKL